MSKEYLSLGVIKDSFGLNGTAKIFSTTTQGERRYKKDNKVLLLNEKDNSVLELTVDSYRHNGDLDFVSFLEINSKEEMEKYKGFKIVVEKDNNDLDNDHFFFTDLEKCQLVDKDNKIIGKVIRVEEFPAQITLRCKAQNGKNFFVPFVKDFIINVDIEKLTIKINVIEGML